MAAIVVKGYNGLKPISDPLLLDNGEAQVANNVFLISGALRPLRALTVLKSLIKTLPPTIYRFDPEQDQPENSYWLEFAQDTDVMRSPIAQDQWKRLYWTDGDEIPKYAPAETVVDADLSGDGSLPGHGYNLGVPKPTTAPTVASFTAPSTVDKVTRSYLLTFWNATASKESTPGKVFTAQTVDGVAVKITNITTDNRGDTGITHKRLYRKVPDASPATTETYRLIATIPLIESEYTDETTDAAAVSLPAMTSGLLNAPPSPLAYPAVGAAPAQATAGAIQRNYVYTIVNLTISGTLYAESAPSPVVAVTADNTQTITISGLTNAGGGQHFRVYRRDGGKPTLQLVAQIPTSSTTLADPLGTTVLAQPLGNYGPDTTAPPAPTLSGTAATPTTVAKRLYMITFANAAGAESGKSPSSEIVEVVDGVTAVELYHSEPLPVGVTKKRLYRQNITLSSGVIIANDADWDFVAENTAAATNATDIIADSALPGTGLAVALQGIPPSPAGTPTTTSTIPASDIPESRVYCYTLVTAYDEEGPPSDSTDVVSVNPEETVTLTVPLPPGGNYNFAKKRIYRSATGTARTKFMYVGEIAAAVTSFADDVPTSQLGELLPSDGWIPPPVGLKGLRLMANGAAVGFKGSSLFLSEPNVPHAWPHEYPIDEPIVGIGVFGQTVAVLTTGFPHLFQGIDPAAMSDTKLELPQACANKRGIVETGDGVIYPSPDGMVMIGSSVAVVTQQIMSREIWQLYAPESMECFVYNGRVIVTYYDGAQRGVLLFDLSGQGAMLTTSDVNAALPLVGGYYSAQNDTLYFSRVNDIVRFDAGAALNLTWKSKKFRQDMHENFGFAQVVCKSYSPSPTFKLYADGVLKHTKLLTSRDQFRLPGGFLALDWEFQLEGAVEFTETFIATSSAELQSA